MASSSIPPRIAQLLFGAVSLALSAVLIAQYGPGGHAPSLYDYGAFCGGAAIVIALVGIAASFNDGLQGAVMLVIDGLAILLLLAGGIAFAAKLKVGSCNDILYFLESDVFLPSLQKLEGLSDKDTINVIQGRCRMAQADTAFLWLTFACAVGAALLSNRSSKSGHSGSIV